MNKEPVFIAREEKFLRKYPGSNLGREPLVRDMTRSLSRGSKRPEMKGSKPVASA